MASQDARLSKFEVDFKQQQSEMTNKIDTVLKAITDRITGTLPKDDEEVMFIEIIRDDDEPQNEDPNEERDLEKEHTKSVYLRNEEDKRRGVEYVMSKILGFYKECLELGPEYLTGVDDKGEVT
ncbi:hypothetical protein Tco_0429311 [Tanacetum coccineum]